MVLELRKPPRLEKEEDTPPKPATRQAPAPSRRRRRQRAEPLDQPARGKTVQVNIANADAEMARQFKAYCKLVERTQNDVFKDMWTLFCNENDIQMKH